MTVRCWCPFWMSFLPCTGAGAADCGIGATSWTPTKAMTTGADAIRADPDQADSPDRAKMPLQNNLVRPKTDVRDRARARKERFRQQFHRIAVEHEPQRFWTGFTGRPVKESRREGRSEQPDRDVAGGRCRHRARRRVPVLPSRLSSAGCRYGCWSRSGIEWGHAYPPSAIRLRDNPRLAWLAGPLPHRCPEKRPDHPHTQDPDGKGLSGEERSRRGDRVEPFRNRTRLRFV